MIQMRMVKVKRNDLLARLQANLNKHLSDCKETTDVYCQAGLAIVTARRKQIDAALGHLAEDLEKGRDVPLTIESTLYFPLQPPKTHERDYRQIIEMVTMSVDDVIELNSAEFQCYVLDNWDWRQEFESNKSGYSSSLSGK